MKWFDRMTVFKKLLLAFAVVIGFCVVIGGTSLTTLSSMHDITDAICDQHMNGLYWMEEANRHKIDSDLAAANLGYAADDAGRQKLKDNIVASLKEMHGAYDQYRATIATSKGQEMFDEVLRKSAVWEGIVHQQIGLEPIPAGVDNNELVRRAIASSETLRDRITALIDYRRQQATEAQQEASADYLHMRIVMLALVLGAIAAGMLLATVIARRLARQLGGEPDYAMHIANRIAGGDLSVRVETRAGDADSMLFALRNMRERLAGIVSGISESSESILLASGEIAQGNTDLSQRTEEQAAALQETASSMQELTSTVKMNAENAQQAGGVAHGASEVAARGSSLVGDVVETMRELAAGSKRMTDIIAVIEGIAFQTNILALNAAVEAARAGEQGRGFAVVANEVRSLAKRSAEAAKEIKSLIHSSIETVNQGGQYVAQAGGSMGEIVTAIQQVAAIVADISHQSSAQANQIRQLATAIREVDSTTQQNAALVEQTAASATMLEDRAGQLRDAAARFRTAAA